MSKSLKGFASMEKSKQRQIASRGGKAAHLQGAAHEWDRDSAREAGRKGGLANGRKRKQQAIEDATPPSPSLGDF
jgi:general stress protein YciG